MDTTVLNPIRAAPEQYALLAEKQLQTAQEQFQQMAARHAKVSAQYCDKESKLERARAIQRAVTAIIAGRRVMFSDEVTLRRWLGNYPCGTGTLAD